MSLITPAISVLIVVFSTIIWKWLQQACGAKNGRWLNRALFFALSILSPYFLYWTLQDGVSSKLEQQMCAAAAVGLVWELAWVLSLQGASMVRTESLRGLGIRNEVLQLQTPLPPFSLAEVPWEMMVDYCTTLLLHCKQTLSNGEADLMH